MKDSKKFYIFVTSFLILINLCFVSANTIESSTMIFEGSLTPSGDGYEGTIDAVAGSYYITGGDGCTDGHTPDGETCVGGFDVYAKEGGCSYVEDYYGTGDWNCNGLDSFLIGSNNDAYPEETDGGPWGTFYSPDVRDWEHYELILNGDDWEAHYKDSDSPFSGTINWENMYAHEDDQNWNADWTWGTEDIPLEYAGFEVDVDDLGGGSYKITLTPANGAITNIDTGEVYDTIQDAIDDTSSGDTIEVKDGTYEITSTLNIDESIILIGESEEGVVVDASSIDGYGISISADDVTVESLTLIGPQGGYDAESPVWDDYKDNYGFKISHMDNLVLRDLTIQGSGNSEIDLNTIDTATIENIEADGQNTPGFGLMIFNSNDITVTDITTDDNDWAGVSIQNKGQIVNNIIFSGEFNVNDDFPFLIEKDPQSGVYYDITNVDIPDKFDYVVYDFREGDDYKQWYYFETLEDAKSFAQGLVDSEIFTYSDIIIYDLDEENYYVEDGMKIQDAIDAASEGDIIEVAPGLYEELITINKALTLRGATYTINKNGYAVPADYAWDTNIESVIQPPEGSEDGNIITVDDASDVTIEGFVIQALERITTDNSNKMLIHVLVDDGNMENLVLKNNVIGPNTGEDQDGEKGRMSIDLDINPYDESMGLTNSSISGNKIFGSEGDGNAIFIWASYYAYGATGPSPMEGTIIEDNEICCGHRSGIETAGGFSGLIIRNNDIHDFSGYAGEETNLKYGHGIVLIRGSSDSGENIGFGPEDLTIEDNKIYDNEKSAIYTGPVSKDYTITGNEIYNNGWDGIRVDMEAHFKNPDFEEEDRVRFYDHCENIIANNNEIYNNGQKGIDVIGTPTNGFILDAENNWWGTNDGEEIADMISENVDYDPWIGQSEAEVETEAGFPEEVDTTGTDTSITLTTIDSSSGTISVQQQGNDPQGGFTASALGKFISIDSTIPEEEITQVEIGISYTDAEVLVAGIDETTLKVYYWDGENWIFEGEEPEETFKGCHDVVGCYGVDTVSNYVWIVTDHFSDYGAGGENDTEGPVIILDHLSQPYPNPDDEEFTVYVYANITDPSGVADYPELAWKIDGIEYSTSMNPLDDLYYGGITAPKIDGLDIVYKITAEDNLNNSEDTGDFQHLFYYDGTAPNTTLEIGEPKYEGSIYVTSATEFTLSCDDGVSGNGCNKTFYKIDEGESTEYSIPFTISGEDGEYTIYYYSIDNSNNTEEENSQIVILDNTEPETTDDSDSDWTDSDVTVTLSPDDGTGSGVAHTYYCIDEEDSCTPSTEGISVSVTCAADSVCEQYVRYYSEDNLGNAESVKTSNQINIDKEKPSTSYSGTDTEWHNEDVTVTLTPTDNFGSGISTTYYCTYLEGEDACNPYADGEEGISVIVSTEGINYIRYQSEDIVGNLEDVKDAENAVKIDKTNPVLEYYSRTNPDDEDMKADDTDAVDTVGYGYYDHIGDGFKWTSDDEYLENISIRFYNGDPDDGGVLIEGADVTGCDLDPLWDEPTNGGEYGGIFYEKYKEFGLLWGSDFTGDYDGTDTCDPLFDNIHNAGIVYYEITAYDLAGNLGRLVGVLNFNQGWERDTTSPETTDDYGEKSDVWQNSVQTITLTENCGSSGCAWTKYCTTESCDPETEGTDYTESVLIDSEGTTYFRYASKDNAYNQQDIVELVVKIDLTIPTISDDYADDGEWVGESQTITLTPSDGTGSGIDQVLYCEGEECDPSSGTVLESPYQLFYTTSQDTIVRYMTIDNAGNPSDIGEFNVKIDLENPTITDDAPEGWQNTGFTVTLSPDDENEISSVKYCIGASCTPDIELTYPYELTYSADQDIIVRYQAWDALGNPSDIGEFEAKIDTVKPDVEDSGPSGTLNNNEVEIFVTTDEETICKYDTSSKSFNKMQFTLGTGNLETDHSTILDLSDGTYNYRVRCQDKAGNNLLPTEILISFTINTAENFGYTADLTPTWDSFILPQFPLLEGLGYTTPELRSPENILASLEGNYEIIWYYDGTDWLSYEPGLPPIANDLTEFNDQTNSPYWIKMINSDRLELVDLTI